MKREAGWLTLSRDTSGVVNSENMEEAIREGFGKSLNGKVAPLQSKIDNFIEIFIIALDNTISLFGYF